MNTDKVTTGPADQAVTPAPGRRGRALYPLVAVPVAILLGWGLVPLALYRAAGPTPPEGRVAHAAPAPNGPALYARNCASCHGPRGDGAGPTGRCPRTVRPPVRG